MIRICPGYERHDGTKVHGEPIELSRSAPSDTDVVHTYCFDCKGELFRDLAKKLRDADHGTVVDHRVGERLSA